MKKQLCKWGIFIFLLSISFAYMDFYATQRHGIEVWNCLQKRDIFSYYTHCLGDGNGIIFGNFLYNGDSPAIYDFPIYLIFAVWNFPLWIYEKITGLNSQDSWILVSWGKQLLTFFVAVCCVYVKKIWELSSEHQERQDSYFNAETVALYMTSSIIVLYYALMCGNYDIIGITFTLIGVYYFLKEDQNKFVFFFAIAIGLKYWGLFCFIPLVLYKNKNFLKIFINILLGCSLVICSKLVFLIHDKSMAEYGIDGILQDLVSEHANWGVGGKISIFILVYFLICCYSYFDDAIELSYNKVLNICIFSYACFVVFDKTMPYWTVVLIPFLTLYVWNDKDKTIHRIVWDCIFQFSLLFYMQASYCWCPDAGTMLNMLPYKILNALKIIKDPSFQGYSWGAVLVKIQTFYDIKIILATIATASIIILIFGSIDILGKRKLQYGNLDINRILKYRMIFSICFCLLPIAFWIIQIIIHF